jgi:hypothetical protein
MRNYYTHEVLFEKYLKHMDHWVADSLPVPASSVARTVENLRTHKRFQYRNIRVRTL